jgi:anti-sigma B factor antagonist
MKEQTAMTESSFHITQFADRNVPLPVLDVLRLPGEMGPILRCCGELSVTTVGDFEREFALQEPVGHRALLLDLAGCDFMDGEGILTILDCFNAQREMGCQLVIVGATGQPARLLRVTGIDQLVPVFPSEEAAVLILGGEGATAPTLDWVEAQATTVALWRCIEELLDTTSAQDILYDVTSLTPLCEHAETSFQERPYSPQDRSEHPSASATRCQFCPLFYALGARQEDVGCRSLLEPIIEALGCQDWPAARDLVARVIRILEEMPLPEEGDARVS